MNANELNLIAQICYEANRAYCQSIGDHSQPPWEDAPQWQRDSHVAGTRTALAGATPEQQHDAWSADKRAAGWTFGPVKDAEAKTHPCLVPYHELPEEQRRKDSLYQAVARAVAGAIQAP